MGRFLSVSCEVNPENLVIGKLIVGFGSISIELLGVFGCVDLVLNNDSKSIRIALEPDVGV